MTNEEAARILDPDTSTEALRPYALDCVMRMAVVEEACRMAANALRATQGWIPVTKRLPEMGERVLTLDKWNHVSDRVLHQFKNGSVCFRPDGMQTGQCITHWMPILEAAKEIES